MDKIVTKISEYSLGIHKLILGVHMDKEGNEFTYQPERLNPETHDFDPTCYCDKCNQAVEEEIKRCDSLNTENKND